MFTSNTNLTNKMIKVNNEERQTPILILKYKKKKNG